MDISELLEKEITNLPPGEKVRALGELLDIIQLETDRISSESRQTFILPVSSIDPFSDHPFYVENDEAILPIKQISTLRHLSMLILSLRARLISRMEERAGDITSSHRIWTCG